MRNVSSGRPATEPVRSPLPPKATDRGLPDTLSPVSGRFPRGHPGRYPYNQAGENSPIPAPCPSGPALCADHRQLRRRAPGPPGLGAHAGGRRARSRPAGSGAHLRAPSARVLSRAGQTARPRCRPRARAHFHAARPAGDAGLAGGGPGASGPVRPAGGTVAGRGFRAHLPGAGAPGPSHPHRHRLLLRCTAPGRLRHAEVRGPAVRHPRAGHAHGGRRRRAHLQLAHP